MVADARRPAEPLLALLVEDDDLVRSAVVVGLSLHGHEVVAAEHGAAALALFAPGGRFAQAPPDVILVDLLMPVMDGATFIRLYRAQPPPHAPIVVFSAASDATTQAEDIGADAILLKPFHIEQLFELLDTVVPSTQLDAGQSETLVGRHRK